MLLSFSQIARKRTDVVHYVAKIRLDVAKDRSPMAKQLFVLMNNAYLFM